MRTILTLSTLLLSLFLTNLHSQDLFVKSDLQGLKLKMGETFEPETYAENLKGERLSCP